MSPCPRCINGRIIVATDEHGQQDDCCVQCGYRVSRVYTADELTAIRKQLKQDKRTRAAQRIAGIKMGR